MSYQWTPEDEASAQAHAATILREQKDAAEQARLAQIAAIENDAERAAAEQINDQRLLRGRAQLAREALQLHTPDDEGYSYLSDADAIRLAFGAPEDDGSGDVGKNIAAANAKPDGWTGGEPGFVRHAVKRYDLDPEEGAS